MNKEEVKKLILELLKDADIRETIGEALVELSREYVEDFISPAVHADTSSIPEYRPIRPEDKR